MNIANFLLERVVTDSIRYILCLKLESVFLISNGIGRDGKEFL